MNVVFDTNAILLPFTDGTDVGRELDRLVGIWTPILPSSVVIELNSLARQNGAVGRAAKAALKWSASWQVMQTDAPGDDGLLDVARRAGGYGLTNDRKVQGELASSGIQVISSRANGRLELRQRRG